MTSYIRVSSCSWDVSLGLEGCWQIYIVNVKKMCGVKVSDIKNTNELMKRLGLEETVVEVVKRSGLRWMGHVLGMEISMNL